LEALKRWGWNEDGSVRYTNYATGFPRVSAFERLYGYATQE